MLSRPIAPRNRAIASSRSSAARSLSGQVVRRGHCAASRNVTMFCRRQRHAAVRGIDAEQRIVQMAEPDRRRTDDRCARAELARLDIDGIGEAVRQERPDALDQYLRAKADRAAHDDLFRIGNGRDRADAARKISGGFVQRRKRSFLAGLLPARRWPAQ